MKRARMPGDETGQRAVTDCRSLTRRTEQPMLTCWRSATILRSTTRSWRLQLCLRIVTSYGRRTCKMGWPSMGDCRSRILFGN